MFRVNGSWSRYLLFFMRMYYVESMIDGETNRQGSGLARRLLLRLFGSGARRAGARVPEGLRIYAVGDIHGRADLLDPLQEKMLADADRISGKRIIQIFLGDYIDRGQDSKAVVDWMLASPPPGWERICLKGNHEATLLDFLETAEIFRQWRQYGGLETLHSYGVDLKSLRGEDAPEALQIDFRAKLPEAHYAFFSALPLMAEFGDYYFTHAGVRPGRRLENQSEEDLLWIRDEFLMSQMDFGKIVVHGHSAQEEPELLANRINLDTGAYITGNLTCLVLDGQGQRIL